MKCLEEGEKGVNVESQNKSVGPQVSHSDYQVRQPNVEQVMDGMI